MENNRLFKGYWWLPSSPENKVAGTLSVGSKGEVVLELIGNVDVEIDGFYLDRKDNPVIFGRCYANGANVTDISLFRCHPSITRHYGSSFSIIRYTCRYALIGIHVESMEEFAFFKSRMCFKELTYWCPPTNVTKTLGERELTLTVDFAEGEDTTKASFKLDDDTTLLVKESVSCFTEFPEVNISQSSYLEIQKDMMNVFQVLDWALRFERFMSVAALRPVEHGRITVYSKNKCQNIKKGEFHYFPIELVTPLYNSEDFDSKETIGFLFKHEDIAAEFGDMFKKLCLDKNMAQILSNLIYSLERKRIFTSNDFLVVAQALDGFAMRFRREQSILNEYTDLRDEFQDIQRLQLTDEDLRAAVDSRNYYSHILKLDKKAVRNVLDGAELLSLTNNLRTLLVCCVLNFMGLDNNRINQLLNGCH